MARLNELPVSSDSLETLRRKMLRQNRDLAKSNNVRALRIRELENECACMLSENLELRGRILELEKQVDDSEARRIADHALAIKAKLESQLTEWGTMIAGLGLEPPLKRHSPRIRKSTSSRQRMSFAAGRPSPSQRRLRDVARDIEDLGHISENKSYPRRSMNPQQILALRSEADEADSPELGPPPMSKFIDDDDDPVKVDSPTRHPPLEPQETSPKATIEPPVSFPSPQVDKVAESPRAPSPEIQTQLPIARPQLDPQPEVPTQSMTAQPVKTGFKRKLAAREEAENTPFQRLMNENQAPRAVAERPSIRDKADGRTLKELAVARKEGREKKEVDWKARAPLAAKSTNVEMRSPKKSFKPKGAEAGPASTKIELTTKPKGPIGRPRSKAKSNPPAKAEAEPGPEAALQPTTDLAPPVPPGEPPVLLSPSSPERPGGEPSPRGDTPPPADISSRGETTRPSRRNRAAVSYAEPNLRDKMRRPSKGMTDAVAGEGRYSRRSSSQVDTPVSESCPPKHEPEDEGDAWKATAAEAREADDPPPSPLAGKDSPPARELPDTIVTERRRRPSSTTNAKKAERTASEGTTGAAQGRAADSDEAKPDPNESGSVDIYEFTSSSPQADREEAGEANKTNNRRQTMASRRVSAAVDNDKPSTGARERSSSRRRSMMV
ncbi:hypothetical protein CDD83_11200 [Cordyceps sp. RAO-2017]|nr:hypothetical protein CDD83_11200 [Cordyceps sp. RAO-2017]